MLDQFAAMLSLLLSDCYILRFVVSSIIYLFLRYVGLSRHGMFLFPGSNCEHLQSGIGLDGLCFLLYPLPAVL